MAQRIALTKKTRFEVLKRDSFTCQYCGRTSPTVILEVDHIVPVAEGGTNDMTNLITSCRDCNRGKGKRMLSEKTSADRKKRQLEDAQILQEQTEMMIQWREELAKVENRQVEYIANIIDKYGSECNMCLNDTGRKLVRRLLREFGFTEVCKAVDLSFDKYFDKDYEKTFAWAVNKIGGVCYNRKHNIKGKADG